MGIGGYMVKGIARELDNKSREFYEFVMPAVDMYEEANDLVVAIDLPGFSKDHINLRITRNVLSISAKRDIEEATGATYQRHRPTKIEKKLLLPISVKEDVTVSGRATYENGVVTLRIPFQRSMNIPIS
jgi:HSP20 family molecular chaperone IbpA